MDQEDIFYKKMGSLENLPRIMDRKNRFGNYNAKTLGFCMVRISVYIEMLYPLLFA